MAVIIAVGELLSAAISSKLPAVPDPRYAFNYAYGLSLPVRIVEDAVGGWRALAVIWAMLALVGFCGWKLSKSLPSMTRLGLTFLLAGLAAIGLLLSIFPVTLAGDVYAYVIYGRLYGLYGLNPYHLATAIQVGQDGILAQCLRFYHNPPPADNYGPLWTLLAGAIARAQAHAPLVATIWTQRIIALLSIMAVAAGLWFILRALDMRARAERVASFAFHPLVLYESAVGGHNDAMMLAFGVWAFALAEDYPLVAGLLLGASIAVKYVSIIILPMMIAKIVRKHGAASAALASIVCGTIVVLAFVPFWIGPQTLHPVLGEFNATRTSPAWVLSVPFYLFNLGDRIVLSAPGLGNLTGPALAQRALWIFFSTVMVWSIVRYYRRLESANLWRAITALVWTLPSLYPWYVLWLSPALAAGGRWARYAWWFGMLVFLHYAEDAGRQASTRGPYEFALGMLVVLTLVFLVVPVLIAMQPGKTPQAKDEPSPRTHS